MLRGASACTSEAFDRDKKMLLASAATLTVDQVSLLMRHWRRCADADGAEPVDDRGELNCSITDQTTVIHGSLSGVDGWFVHETLARVAEELYRAQQACPDGRPVSTPAQRRAKALVEICRRAMATDPQTARPVAPLIMATIDLDTLQDKAGWVAEVDGYGHITPSEARRLACDAHISRLITGPNSEILDLGRTSRLPNRAQRRAIRARDKGCAVPGCHAPPGWCRIHHIRYWIKHHGPTDLNNLVMLCNSHHTMVHNNQLTIDVDDQGHFTFRRSDGTIMNPLPMAP